MLTRKQGVERCMNKFEEKSRRDLLAGLRTAVKALEEKDGFVLKFDGKIVNKERAEELRQQIAYLEAILPPKVAPSTSPT
jgi:hypothetical protein